MTDSVRMALAGALASAAAALTLLPLLETREWVAPTWAAVALVVLTGLGLRSLRLPRPLVPLGQLLVLFEALLLVTAGTAMGYVLVPTPDAVRLLGEQFALGLGAISEYASPAPVLPELVLVAATGIALVAIAVDALAATWRLVAWTGIPLLLAYAIPAGIVRGGLDWWLFVPVAAGYVWLLVTESHGRVAHWGRSVSGGRARRGALPRTSALSTSGRRLGLVVIGASVLLPAVLPALPEGVFSRGTGGGGEGGGRVITTDNPIVDLRRDLVRPDDVELLRYRTSDERPDYIRTVALDEYDGRAWKASRRAVPEEQRVENGLPDPPGLSGATDRSEVTTEFTVSEALDSQWLPLAYPTRLVEIDGDWRYAAATLDVVGSDVRTPGATYRTESLRIETDRERLDAAGEPPEELRPQTVIFPRTRPVIEEALAEVFPNGRPDSDWAAAVAVQDWFRSEFEYSTERRPGNSDAALSAFLAERTGYCEQYAATMALMARQLDIPARVGVGYLPGERDGEEWVVTANDAHAWPELYFEGAGWVRFEPTPGARTGVAPPWTVPGLANESPTPTASTSASGSAAGAPLPRDDITEVGVDDAGTTQPVPWGRLAVVALAVLAVALTPLTALVARRRRWAAAEADPVASAEAAWTDLRDAVRDSRAPWDEALSPRTTAGSVGSDNRLPSDAREALTRVAGAVELARYARRPAEVSGLRDDVDAVRSALMDKRPWGVRVRARLLPSAGRDAIGQAVGAGGSALDAVQLAGHRLRERVPVGRKD